MRNQRNFSHSYHSGQLRGFHLRKSFQFDILISFMQIGGHWRFNIGLIIATQIKLKRHRATSSEVLLDEGLGFHEDPTYLRLWYGSWQTTFYIRKSHYKSAHQMLTATKRIKKSNNNFLNKNNIFNFFPILDHSYVSNGFV